jgi:hypothetical protein
MNAATIELLASDVGMAAFLMHQDDLFYARARGRLPMSDLRVLKKEEPAIKKTQHVAKQNHMLSLCLIDLARLSKLPQ